MYVCPCKILHVHVCTLTLTHSNTHTHSLTHTHTHTAIEVDDLTVGITATATFFCNVTGLTDPSSIQYSWRQTQNGVYPQTLFPSVIFGNRVNGAAAPTLMITNVGPMDDDFDYTCYVSNTNGGRIVGDATGTLTTIGTSTLSLSLPPSLIIQTIPYSRKIWR